MSHLCRPWEVALNVYLVATTFLIGLPLLLTYGTLFQHLRKHMRDMQRMAREEHIIVSRAEPTSPDGKSEEGTSVILRSVTKKIGKFAIAVLIVSIIWLLVLLGKGMFNNVARFRWTSCNVWQHSFKTETCWKT